MNLSKCAVTALLGLAALAPLQASAEDKAAPQPPHWTLTGSLASARADFTTTALLDGTTLAVGGGPSASGPGQVTCELYDPVTRTWSPTGSLARPRFAHTATRLVDGRVLVVGGAEAFGSPLHAETELYDPVSHTWSLAAPIPIARMFHSAVLMSDGRVLVAGGDYPGPGDTATAFTYDPASNAWSAAGSMSVAREPGRFGSIALRNGDVLVAGGYDITTGGSFAAADRYVAATNTWSTLPNLTESRNGNTLERLADGRILVIGGKNGAQIRSSTEVFDGSTNTWSAGPALHVGRWAHTSVSLGNGQLLVIGGRTASGDTATVERYDFSTNTWTNVAAMNAKRFKLGITMTTTGAWVGESFVKVRRILAAGGAEGTVSTNTAEELLVPVSAYSTDEN